MPINKTWILLTRKDNRFAIPRQKLRICSKTLLFLTLDDRYAIIEAWSADNLDLVLGNVCPYFVWACLTLICAVKRVIFEVASVPATGSHGMLLENYAAVSTLFIPSEVPLDLIWINLRMRETENDLNQGTRATLLYVIKMTLATRSIC